MKLGYKDLCKDAAKELGMEEERVAFIVENVFTSWKSVVKNQLFVKFWKGVSLYPFSIVTSPKSLLIRKRYEKFLFWRKYWTEYKNNKKDFGKGETVFDIDKYPHLKKDFYRYLKERELLTFVKAMNNAMKDREEGETDKETDKETDNKQNR